MRRRTVPIQKRYHSTRPPITAAQRILLKHHNQPAKTKRSALHMLRPLSSTKPSTTSTSAATMLSVSLCQIWMVSSYDTGKLFVKVERGTKPRLKLFEECRKAQVTIPTNQSTKWPDLKAQMSGGLTIIVQRLEQQYKITVQHVLERKPEVCVYVNAMAHERDVKTSVREMNTQLKHIGVAGPNLEVTGRIRAQRVTFESTVGALHTNAKLFARSVTLNAQNIFIKTEALFSCAKIRMMSRRVQIDGRICPWDEQPDRMNVAVDSALLHIGIDGVIGSLKSLKEKSTYKSSDSLVDLLSFRLTGSLANFGRIVSKSEIDLRVNGSILSLKDGRIDSATRGYEALKQIKGILSETSDSLPTSSTLSSAIVGQNPGTVAQLLEEGVDPNDSASEASKACTPRRIAARKYREIRTGEHRNHLRENITIIHALMSTHDWKRGLITSNMITATVGRDCADCAQFRASTLVLTARGNAKCEANSIWSSGSVTLTVGNDLTFEGQVKHRHLEATCGGTVITTEEAIVSEENWAKISCSSFNCAGIWSVCEHLSIEAHSAEFLLDSFIEVDLFDAKIEGNCHNAGTWQMRFISMSLDGNLITLQSGKVMVDETADISAMTFSCSGAWRVNESIELNLRGSANFFSSSHLTANVLKMIVECHGTLAGFLGVENLLAYIRNDLISASTAKVAIGNGATIATGAFRNDASWISEQNLHLHVACFEQSEDAIIFVKDTLNMIIYDDSEENSHGRIVANYCLIRSNRKFRFDGYIRVNQIEINLPFTSESRCTIGGQLEILAGPLILLGHSDLSPASFSSSALTTHSLVPHQWPAFVLEGQLKAEAVIAPFLAVRFGTSSYALLSGIDSIIEAPYRALVSVGSLHTMPTSLIDSVSTDHYPEGLMCATVWVHEGQIRFHGDSSHLIVDSFLNKGRLTNEGKLHNHMKEVFVSVANQFENNAVLSADKIHILGDGELQNKNRIFATDVMDIQLANFSNEIGHMQSKNMKLLSATREWTKINGRIEAPGSLDISGSKLCVATKSLDPQKEIRLSARAQVLVSSDVNDEFGSISLAARDAILFEANVTLDRIELTLGTAYEAEVVVGEERVITVNNLRITGKCRRLTITLNGSISCGSMIVEDSIGHVKIVGKGTLHCRRSLNVAGDGIAFLLQELCANEILAKSVTLDSNVGCAKLTPSDAAQSLCVYASSCTLHGRIMIDGKICLKASKGIVKIDGDLVGSPMNSELSVDCDDLVLSGYVSNLEFIEVYARKRIEFCDTAVIRNSRNAAMEAGYIALDGKIRNCEALLATADEVAVDGTLSNDNSRGAYAIFGKTIRFDGLASGIEHFELNSANEVIINGRMSGIGTIEVDAKWTRWHADVINCHHINAVSYSIALSGAITVDTMKVNCLGAIFNRCNVNTSSFCALYAPFVFTIGESASLPKTNAQISALLYASDKSDYELNIFEPERICWQLHFVDAVNEEVISKRQSELCQQATLFLEKTFRSPSIILNEIVDGLKYMGKIQPVLLTLPKTSLLYKDISKTVAKFALEHVSMFNPPELIAQLRAYQSKVTVNERDDLSEPATYVTRFAAEAIYDVANRFRARSKKYAVTSPHCSAEDGGYASRSSSEDIDEKKSTPVSPAFSFGKETVSASSKPISDCGDEIDREIEVQALGRIHTPDVLIHEGTSEDSGDELTTRQEHATSYVLNGDRKIAIAFIDFKKLDVVISKPRLDVPRRTPSTSDLALKRRKVKMALSNLDLRSFGSDSSLASFDATESGTPMRMVLSPAKRSLIPRSSYRRPLTIS